MKNNKNNNSTNNYYNKPTEEIFSSLSTNSKGLTDEEAKLRLKKYGYNELKIKKRSPLIRFLLQFHNPLIYVLLRGYSYLAVRFSKCNRRVYSGRKSRISNRSAEKDDSS
ncbi:MAG: hypothetical protein CVT89_01550 [Candidatus Altiarchaeales archaeon HGW-Altiarchaeales-2]|nr:MAG: hypothetical protein CVT89_01550 [Candidatus Altiarchaeales archaeon HGW-Altiarchaeales-2]